MFAALALGLVLLASSVGPARDKAPDGGGPAPFLHERTSCLDDEQRRAIQERLLGRIRALEAQGLIEAPAALGAGSLGWPLAKAPGLLDPGYHGVSNFVDLEAAFPNQLRDYQCGARTYDTAGGYNHSGIDYFTWPFAWLKMDQSLVQIVAAAPGVILDKADGNADRSCTTSGGDWNAVYVRHADGSVIWYGHMKRGSLTAKPVGSSVAAGEYLGLVGSSGNATGPHLHFEVHDAGGRVLEPHSGPCQGAPSLWQAERPYYDSAINALLTHSSPPVFPTCPAAETPNTLDVFAPGARAYFAAYYRDQRLGQVTEFTLRRPDRSVFTTWTSSSGVPHYAASYWYWWFDLPTAPLGTWTFEARYEGVTTTRRFALGSFGPVVSQIVPNTGPIGGGQAVNVYGSGFAAGASLSIGGAAASSVSVVSANRIAALSPAHVTGLGDVVVANPGGISGSLPSAFFFAPPPVPTAFRTLPPCRVVDTREATGPTAGLPLPASSARTLTIAGSCGVPGSARAVSLNLTVVTPEASGFVTIYPGNGLAGTTSVINFVAGKTVANNAVGPLATDGAGTLGVVNGAAGTLHLIVDVNGYFE
ncbi:MAG TPA: peptidoglycan DD-metalloendopeptidase family protein [Vicinamibacteria bacterium]